MINTKTVLVLGAGASYPYGFPLGAELHDRICRYATHNLEPDIASLLHDCGHEIVDVKLPRQGPSPKPRLAGVVGAYEFRY